jgi:5-methylcytosine-specific restriction endonuclease McrA
LHPLQTQRIAEQTARDRQRWDEVSKYRQRWWKRNADRAAEYNSRRRAAKRGNGGTHRAADIKALFIEQHGRCFYCRCLLVKYHVDHKTALSRGGSNGRENLRLACPRCNLRKRTRTAEEFIALLAAA